MSNLRLMYRNLIQLTGVSLSATDEETTLPVENVAHPFRSLVWRTTQATGATITFDLGQGYTVDALGVYGHNLTGGTITWQAATMASFATLLTTMTLTRRDGMIFGFPVLHNARYHRIRFENAANSDGYMEVGGIYIGEYFEPEANFHVDYQTGKKDLSVTSENENGYYFSDEKNQRRNIKLNWKSPVTVEQDDREELEAFFDYVGKKKDFIMLLDYTNEPDWAYYGRLAEDINFSNVSSHNWYEVSLNFMEAL